MKDELFDAERIRQNRVTFYFLADVFYAAGHPQRKFWAKKISIFCFLGDEGVLNCLRLIAVMYFDQQISAPHTVCWSKSSFSAINKFYKFFPSQTGKK